MQNFTKILYYENLELYGIQLAGTVEGFSEVTKHSSGILKSGVCPSGGSSPEAM